MSFENKILAIEQKIKALKTANDEANVLIEQLRSDNKALKAEMEGLRLQLKDFQNQEKIAKIAGTILKNSEDSEELKVKIGEYIKELDKCIAHFSN